MMPPLWASLTLGMILFLCIPRQMINRPVTASTGLLLCLLVASIPVKGLPLSAWMRGAIDDLSMVSLMLLAMACMSRYLGHAVMRPREKTATAILVLVAGIILYPASMGMSMTDPWQWGFEPRPMILILGMLAVACCWRGWWNMAMLVCMSTLAFLLQLKESENYWDYLIDPLLVIAMAIGLVKRLASSLLHAASPSP